MRKVSPQVAGAVVVSMVFVLVVGFIEIARLEPPGLAGQPAPGANGRAAPGEGAGQPQGPDCMQVESELYARIDQSRSCTVDADCALVSFGCPFECVTAVSQPLLDGLQQDERSFQRGCYRCDSDCPSTLDKWRATCVRQRCIVLDRSIDELQEETLRRMNEAG